MPPRRSPWKTCHVPSEVRSILPELVHVVRREQSEELTTFLDSELGQKTFDGGQIQRFTFTLATTYAGTLIAYAERNLSDSREVQIAALQRQALDSALAVGLAVYPNPEGLLLQRLGGPIVYKPSSISEWDPSAFWTTVALAAGASKIGRCTLTERLEAYDKAVDYLEHHGRPLPLQSR